MAKLLGFIYRNGKTDCTAGGLSSKVDMADMHFKYERPTHEVDASGWSPSEAKALVNDQCSRFKDDSFMIVEDICCGKRRLRAITVADLKSGDWTMMGGNFIHTCDSRGFHHPIPIHDRVEGRSLVNEKSSLTPEEEQEYMNLKDSHVGDPGWARWQELNTLRVMPICEKCGSRVVQLIDGLCAPCIL